MRKTITLALLVAMCMTTIHAANPRQWVNRCLQQVNVFPQEKAYLHIDRSRYVAGDRIWLKAYVVDAVTLRPAHISNYVYVELLSEKGVVIKRVKLLDDENGFAGHIDLPDDVDTGTYHLRTYTQYMTEVTGHESLTTLEIVNPHSKQKTSSARDAIVGLYPEGGYLVTGELCRLGIEAVSTDGTPLEAYVAIIDPKGDTVAVSKTGTNGLGDIQFVPQPATHYTAKYKLGVNKTVTARLPESRTDVAVIACERYENQLVVSVKGVDNDYFVLAHHNGVPFYIEEISKKKPLRLNTEALPQGVSQFLLLDREGNTLSRRLVFGSIDSILINTAFLTDTVATRRSINNLEIEFPNFIADSINCSIAVTEKKSARLSPTNNIVIELALASDILGGLVNAGEWTSAKPKDIDLLMLVKGWSRYDIPATLRGEIQLPKVVPEQRLSMTGKVTSLLFNRPQRDATVSAISPQLGTFAVTTTDDSGYFELTGIDAPEGTDFVLQAASQKGSDNVVLNVDEPVFKHISHDYNSRLKQERIPFVSDDNPDDFHIDLSSGIVLDDVRVTAFKFNNDIGNTGFEQFSDFSMTRKQIEDIDATCLHELLRRVPGVFMKEEKCYIRANTTIYGDNPATIAIDGVIMGTDYDLDLIQMQDVERVDVFKTGNTAIWGHLGGSGVVEITLKDGSHAPKTRPKSNVKTVTPLGFQMPAEFYSPNYSEDYMKLNPEPDMRRTLYWNPCAHIDKNGKGSISFSTGDRTGCFVITVEGVTNSGKLIYKQQEFYVK